MFNFGIWAFLKNEQQNTFLIFNLIKKQAQHLFIWRKAAVIRSYDIYVIPEKTV